MADFKTLYTDIFTNAPISSQIPYQSIDLATNSNAQLVWPAQSISVTNPINPTGKNYYVGQLTDLLYATAGASVSSVYLPDIKQMPAGSSFTLVNRTANGRIINVIPYDGGSLMLLNDGGVPTAYTFYIADNTNDQTGWRVLPSANYLLPYNKVDFAAGQNVSLIWANQLLPTLGAYAANIFNVFDSSPWHANTISLPDARLVPVGTSLNLTYLTIGSTAIYLVKDFNGSTLTTIPAGVVPSATFYVKDNTQNNGFTTWGAIEMKSLG